MWWRLSNHTINGLRRKNYCKQLKFPMEFMWLVSVCVGFFFVTSIASHFLSNSYHNGLYGVTPFVFHDIFFGDSVTNTHFVTWNTMGRCRIRWKMEHRWDNGCKCRPNWIFRVWRDKWERIPNANLQLNIWLHFDFSLTPFHSLQPLSFHSLLPLSNDLF